MYSLLIDTHLNMITIILYLNGVVKNIEVEESTSGHSEKAMPMIDLMLKKSNINPTDLSEILVINGPGSFTGVRIGVTIAKTLAFSLNIPIKVMSALLIKAICLQDEKAVYINDKNGYYIATFDENNSLVGHCQYLSNKEVDLNMLNNPQDIDYNLVYQHSKKIAPTNPHLVKPLYIKKIQAENDKKS